MVVALTPQRIQKMYVMKCQFAVTAYLNNICYVAVFYSLRCQFYIVMRLCVRRIYLVRHQRFREELIHVFLCYDADRVENYASNSSSLPREHIYRVVA
jgi:hypothetical protein